MTLKMTCLNVFNKSEYIIDSSGLGVGALCFRHHSFSICALKEVVRFKYNNVYQILPMTFRTEGGAIPLEPILFYFLKIMSSVCILSDKEDEKGMSFPPICFS